MKNNNSNTPEEEVCKRYNVSYYTLPLFQRALAEAKNEEDLIRMIFQPIVKIVIAKKWFRNGLEKYYEDACQQALLDLICFSRAHTLEANKENLHRLISIAISARKKTQKEFYKHEAPVKPEINDLPQRKLIGRRVYPQAEFDNEDDDPLQRFFDLLFADEEGSERVCYRILIKNLLKSADDDKIEQIIINASYVLGIWDEIRKKTGVDKSFKFIDTSDYLNQIFKSLAPLFTCCGMRDELKALYNRAITVFDYQRISIKYLESRIYNRKRAHLLEL